MVRFCSPADEIAADPSTLKTDTDAASLIVTVWLLVPVVKIVALLVELPVPPVTSTVVAPLPFSVIDCVPLEPTCLIEAALLPPVPVPPAMVSPPLPTVMLWPPVLPALLVAMVAKPLVVPEPLPPVREMLLAVMLCRPVPL